eukprot:GHVR01099688.1.p1 GENE.GHVR01099688.1~~GHVR01099688.1.p1  ORF type:complete len:202 (+),score=27.95 GHVR01099688.1:143-748(+)
MSHSTNQRLAILDTRRGMALDVYESFDDLVRGAIWTRLARAGDTEQELLALRRDVDVIEDEMRVEGFHLQDHTGRGTPESEGPMEEAHMSSDVREMKPCPFCGSEAELVTGEECAAVRCVKVPLHQLVVSGDNNAANEATEAWNNRAVLSEQEPVAFRWDSTRFTGTTGDWEPYEYGPHPPVMAKNVVGLVPARPHDGETA